MRLTLHRLSTFWIALLVAFAATLPAVAQDDERFVSWLPVDGAITPVVAQYLSNSIEAAFEDDAEYVVIQLNTPGGSIDQTETILTAIENSQLPVVVWVGPRGATAASAGTFITLAAHVAAMAEGTSIGAASPVTASGGDIGETMKRKVESMLVTRTRNLAQRRGAQAQEWAKSAVLDAVSATAEEALDYKVIDMIANDRDDLFAQLNGQIVVVQGVSMQLDGMNVQVRERGFGVMERIMLFIQDPTIAYLLLAIGAASIWYEVINPGIGFSGVFGSICLLLGLYAVGSLPVNYTGVALILMSFALFFADAKTGGNGLLSLGGVAALVTGGLVLFNSPHYEVSRVVLGSTGVVLGGFCAFAGRMAYRAQTRQPATGAEGILGVRGVVREDLDPDGLVMVQGALWRATASDGPLAQNEKIEVVSVVGLRLHVCRATTTDDSREIG